MTRPAGPKHPQGLGNRSGQVGRNLMFHYFTLGIGLFTENVHAWRGPSTTFTIGDFVGPVTGRAARAAGLPYLKGGICEVGGGVLLLEEAQLYSGLANGYGIVLKQLLRGLALRDHIGGMQMLGEDLPQHGNRVDLDPHVRDFHGLPVPRITYSSHKHELAASAHFGPQLSAGPHRASTRVLKHSWISSRVRQEIRLAAPTQRRTSWERPEWAMIRPPRSWIRSAVSTNSTTSTSRTALCLCHLGVSTRR
jgi:hypothetical protein